MPPRAEIPFHFEVDDRGRRAVHADAQPVADAHAVADRHRDAGAGRRGRDGAQPAVAAGFGVGGLLVGVIGGIVLRRRRR